MDPIDVVSIVVLLLGAAVAIRILVTVELEEARRRRRRPAALPSIEAQYAQTRERLAADPEYIRLSVAAQHEKETTPDTYLARNRFWLYVEINTPWTSR